MWVIKIIRESQANSLVFVMIKIYPLHIVWLLLFSSPALAMPQGGCGAGDCRDCHALNKQEAAALLRGKVTEVVAVKCSQVPGLWGVEAIHKGRKIPLYIDFSKQYLLSGTIVRLGNGENLTRQNFIQMNRVDISRIPLGDAVIIGNPVAYDKARAIVCAKIKGGNGRAQALLADSLAGKALPPPVCDNDQLDQNIALAKRLYITTTPTLVMPDGRVLSGCRVAEKIVEAVNAQ